MFLLLLGGLSVFADLFLYMSQAGSSFFQLQVNGFSFGLGVSVQFFLFLDKFVLETGFFVVQLPILLEQRGLKLLQATFARLFIVGRFFQLALDALVKF